MQLSDNLRRIRRERGLTQEGLAERSGMSKSQISRLEGGKQNNPELQTVVTLGTALGASLDELVFGEASPNKARHLISAVERLPKEKQVTVNELLTAFIAQSTAEEIRKPVQ